MVGQGRVFGISVYQALERVLDAVLVTILTSRHAGPEARITATAALPAAVDNA